MIKLDVWFTINDYHLEKLRVLNGQHVIICDHMRVPVWCSGFEVDGLEFEVQERDRLYDEHHHLYLTQSVDKVVLQKSIFAQIRQLILYISNGKE